MQYIYNNANIYIYIYKKAIITIVFQINLLNED